MDKSFGKGVVKRRSAHRGSHKGSNMLQENMQPSRKRCKTGRGLIMDYEPSMFIFIHLGKGR